MDYINNNLQDDKQHYRDPRWIDCWEERCSAEKDECNLEEYNDSHQIYYEDDRK